MKNAEDAAKSINARLKRKALKLPSTSNNAVVAAKAVELLGFTGNLLHYNVAGQLGRVLVKLDIKPFDTNRLAAYKEKKRAEAQKNRKESLTRSGMRVAATWVATPISKYKKPIPDFVLSKAVQIKEACPEAQFFVDALTTRVRRRYATYVKPKVSSSTVYDYDPFLVVQLGDERYWIEVWNEPEFESALIDE